MSTIDQTRTVIHDNDGHVDDLLSSVLLWLSPSVDLQAVTITNGDCYAPESFRALLKMATYLGLEGPEIALSEDSVPYPFPDNWRKESRIINDLPIFSEISLKKLYQDGQGRRSETLIKDCLSNSRDKVTIVATGPLTNVAKVFEDRPELKDKVEEFVIMGGAIKVPGNVEREDKDGTAEWNVFADPVALKMILELGAPVKLITLDITNQLPLNKDFLARLEQQAETHNASKLALSLWSLVKGYEYYFWDTVTVAAVMDPNIFSFKDIRVNIVTEGPSQGRLTTHLFGGRKVKAAIKVNNKAFEDLLLKTLAIR